MKTWNPPWTLAWFVPLGLLSLDTAAGLWLGTNILLVFIGVLTIWQKSTFSERGKKLFGVALIVALFFPSTIVALLFGQVNLLVFAGIFGFLALYEQGNDWQAGAILALTMSKPHLAYLTIPMLLLSAWRERRWHVWFGFGGMLAISTIIVGFLYPNFINAYSSGVQDGGLLGWETATLATYLHLMTGWGVITFDGGFGLATHFMGLVALPSTFFFGRMGRSDYYFVVDYHAFWLEL